MTDVTTLHRACRGGDIEKVKLMIGDNFIVNGHEINFALKGACYGGHMDIVKFLIEKGAKNYSYGAYGACYGGYYDVVKYLIDLGADDFPWLFVSACQGGNLDIVKLIYETAESKKSGVTTNDLEIGLHCVCCHGYDDIAKYIIEIVKKKKRVIDMDFVLCRASEDMKKLVLAK